MTEKYDKPFRLRFLEGVTDTLATITPDNGYRTDLSKKGQVSRGRLTYGDKDPLPLVAIIEPPLFDVAKTAPLAATVKDLPWHLVIQGFVDDDKDHPTDPAHILLADVKKALALEIQNVQTGPTRNGSVFGVSVSRVKSITLDMGFVRPSDDTSSKAYFWLPMRVVVIEDWLKQYDD